MLSTLESVVERLVEGYAPERIILFGSRATGCERMDSDIDLLVVKDTESSPLDRRIEVEGLLADRSVPLDIIVYTPREVLQLFASGSVLVEEVAERGRVLYMRRNTEVWLADAKEELESASILLEHGKQRGAALHSQQGADKALKALILEKGRRPARTHDLLELLNAAKSEGWAVEVPVDDAVYLNSIYRGRYPTEEGLLPHGEPTLEEARRALGAAERIVLQGAALLANPPASG